MTTRLFVYGTLAPGRIAWSVLEPWVVGTATADAVAGVLYDTGLGYPAATFAPPPASPGSVGHGLSVVHGMIVTLDPERAQVALGTLDRYEGDDYERVTVRTRAGLEVAAYAWIAPLTSCRALSHGRWNDHAQAETRRPDGR